MTTEIRRESTQEQWIIQGTVRVRDNKKIQESKRNIGKKIKVRLSHLLVCFFFIHWVVRRRVKKGNK